MCIWYNVICQISKANAIKSNAKNKLPLTTLYLTDDFATFNNDDGVNYTTFNYLYYRYI